MYVLIAVFIATNISDVGNIKSPGYAFAEFNSQQACEAAIAVAEQKTQQFAKGMPVGWHYLACVPKG